MPHLSPLYRFLTVFCTVFAIRFGANFFAVLDDFFFGFTVSNNTPLPPSIFALASYNFRTFVSNDPNDEAKFSSAEFLTYHGKEQFSLSFLIH